MLAPDDRTVLHTALRPAPGCELDIGVATTFTLDLTAALVAPLAFGALGAGSRDPLAVLEAVRSTAGHLTVFAQAGNIRVPSRPSDLMALLEAMVVEVEAPNPGFLFHPKVWVVRYRTPEGPAFRLVCGTRNLTDDVSWDAVVCLDGLPAEGSPSTDNGPLVELVGALPGLAVRPLPGDRVEAIADLAESLGGVEWELPAQVSSMAFHVLGLGGRSGSSTFVDALAGRRHLVVSPFLDDAGLASVVGTGGDATVVSRPEALERLAPSTLDGLTCKVLSSYAGLDSVSDEVAPGDGEGGRDGGTLGVLGGLHAKAYVVESGRQARLFVGSANATTAGCQGGNVEVMVELQAGPTALGVDRFVGEDAPMVALLQPYDPSGGAEVPEAEEVGRQLDALLRRVAASGLTATVESDGEGDGDAEGGRWRAVITSDVPVALPEGARLTVGLLTRPGEARPVADGHPVEAVIAGLDLGDVTPFVVLRVGVDVVGGSVERSSVVRASLVGDPPGRHDRVIARQLDTPEKFLRFLALLLGLAGEGPPPVVLGEADGPAGQWAARGSGPGLFELLVRTLAERPDELAAIEGWVESLRATDRGRAVLPAGFDDLWACLLAARDHLEAGR